jgi:hypothetical protein
MGICASAVVVVLVMEEVVESDDHDVTTALSKVVDSSTIDSVVVKEVGIVVADDPSHVVSDAKVSREDLSEEDASRVTDVVSSVARVEAKVVEVNS